MLKQSRGGFAIRRDVKQQDTLATRGGSARRDSLCDSFDPLCTSQDSVSPFDCRLMLRIVVSHLMVKPRISEFLLTDRSLVSRSTISFLCEFLFEHVEIWTLFLEFRLQMAVVTVCLTTCLPEKDVFLQCLYCIQMGPGTFSYYLSDLCTNVQCQKEEN